MGAQAVGIAAVAAVRQLVPVYFASGDTRTPVLCSTANLLAFVGLALWLRHGLGHAGVGLALSVANGVQMVLLWILLRRKVPALRLGEIGQTAGRTLVACAAAGGAAWLAVQWVPLEPGASQGLRLLPATAACLAFGVVFVAVAWLLRCAELRSLAAALRRRLTAPDEG